MWLYMCVMCTFCNDIKKGYCYSCLERIVSGLAYMCHWLSPLDAIQKHFESLLTFVACHNNLLCFRKFFIVDARCSKLDPLSLIWFPFSLAHSIANIRNLVYQKSKHIFTCSLYLNFWYHYFGSFSHFSLRLHFEVASTWISDSINVAYLLI